MNLSTLIKLSLSAFWQGTIIYLQIQTNKEINPAEVVANRTNVVVSNSFADECIAKLLLHMTLTELKSRTTFKGLNPIASECVLTALRRRHLATA